NQIGAGGQAVSIDLQDMQVRLHSVDAVFALAIRDGEGAVFKINSDAGNSSFTRVLHVVAVAILKNFADDESAVAEHAALHVDVGAGGVGLRTAGAGRGAVHVIADVCSRPDQHAISQLHIGVCCQRADTESKQRTFAGRIGDGRSVQPCTVRLVNKSGGKIVRHLHVGQRS